jgi:hypothetical protein
LNGLAIGDIGWCRDPYTTPSTIKYASIGDKEFHEPKWSESWFPDAFIGTMAQLLIALETGTEPAISAADNLKTMALVEAAYMSTRKNLIMEFDDSKAPERLAALTERLAKIKTKMGAASPQASSERTVEAGPPGRESSFNNFTPRSQQVLALAHKEANRLNHNFVGTEHLLLGLIALNQGVAVNVLQKLGLELGTVRMEVEKQVGTGPDQKIIGNIPYTPRVKKVLALAAKEAKNLNHTYVGTEHILLGLLREGDGVAARVLKSMGINLEETRKEILSELQPTFPNAPFQFDEKFGQEPAVVTQSISGASATDDLFALELPPTPAARKVLTIAREEAKRLGDESIGAEHLLIGLIAVGHGLAYDALTKFGFRLAELQATPMKEAAVEGHHKGSNRMDVSRARTALSLAKAEAKALRQNFLGVEHILLGLLRVEWGPVPIIFQRYGVDRAKARAELLKEIERIFGRQDDSRE